MDTQLSEEVAAHLAKQPDLGVPAETGPRPYFGCPERLESTESQDDVACGVGAVDESTTAKSAEDIRDEVSWDLSGGWVRIHV